MILLFGSHDPLRLFDELGTQNGETVAIRCVLRDPGAIVI